MTDGYKPRRSTTRRKTTKRKGGNKPPVVSVRSGYMEMAQWESDGESRGPTIKLQKRLPPREGSDEEWRNVGSIWMFPNEVEENLTELLDAFLEKMLKDED